MMLQSKLSKEFQGEAVLCATYLLNRSPTVALNNKTPAEMFFDKKPSLHNLKVFGCLAYAKIPQEKVRSKFDLEQMQQ